jgi:hypothetical protein
MTNATITKKSLYTPHGWVGARYSRDLSMNDITTIIRGYMKVHYPNCKFSVTKRHHSSISISLMTAPFDVFSTPDVDKIPMSRCGDTISIMDHWASLPTKGNLGVNHYYIADSFMLTDKAKDLFTNIVNFVKSFNYDDSDAMTDYFDTNFYLDVSIGKWDKPFIRTTK